MYYSTITEYLEYMFGNFQVEIRKMDSICELRNVSFEGGNLPDYSNRAQALLYCLRYHFGYAFEYDYMYRNHILPEYEGEKINVLSIGCGNGIDYWALRHAIAEEYSNINQVNYIGIDCVDWEEVFESVAIDNVVYYHTDVQKSKTILDSISHIDVLFFPKSISELRYDDLMLISDHIHSKTKQLCVAASFRRETYNSSEDVAKYDYLIERLESYGFSITRGEKSIQYSSTNNSVGVRKLFGEYIYPDTARKYITGLYDNCTERIGDRSLCSYSCKETMSRSPILSVSQVCYNYIILTNNADI